MLKVFLSFLALTVVLVTVSFAGLSFSGMSHMDAMNNDASCLNHCLTVASTELNTITPLSIALAITIVFFILLSFSQVPETVFQVSIEPWRNSIGKLLHKLKLATILIRD